MLIIKTEDEEREKSNQSEYSDTHMESMIQAENQDNLSQVE